MNNNEHHQHHFDRPTTAFVQMPHGGVHIDQCIECGYVSIWPNEKWFRAIVQLVELLGG